MFHGNKTPKRVGQKELLKKINEMKKKEREKLLSEVNACLAEANSIVEATEYKIGN